jgi:hypothetical protein
MPPNTGSRRGPSHSTPSMLAARDHARGAVLRRGHDGDGRRSVASFGALCNAPDRRLCAGVEEWIVPGLGAPITQFWAAPWPPTNRRGRPLSLAEGSNPRGSQEDPHMATALLSGWLLVIGPLVINQPTVRGDLDRASPRIGLINRRVNQVRVFELLHRWSHRGRTIEVELFKVTG